MLLSSVKIFIKNNYLFLGLTLLIYIVFIGDLFFSGPINTHIWRQTDCLSMTENYRLGTSFLEPEMHIQLGNDLQSGKSAGEFPVLYWLVGNIWKVTGPSHFTYRFIYALIFLSGLVAYFLTIKKINLSHFWTQFLSLILFISPVFLYYSTSFLTDSPAISFSFIAVYFMVNYVITKKYKWLVISIIFFALTGLLKVSALIPFVFVLAVFMLEFFGVKMHPRKVLFRHNIKEVLLLFLFFIILLGWYVYAAYYNQSSGFKYTFNSIYPFWKFELYDFYNLWNDIKTKSGPVFLSFWTLMLLLVLWIFNLLTFKKNIALFSWMNFLIPLGAIFYIALWFPLFGVHDYYYIALVVILPSIFISFIVNLKNNYPKLYKSRILRILGIFFITFNLIYSSEVISLKKGDKKSPTNLIINNEHFVNFMNWVNYDVESNTYQYVRLEKKLEGLNCGKSDKIITLSDVSFNISLYFLKRKGWTNFKNISTKEEVMKLKMVGAKWIILFEKDIERFNFLGLKETNYTEKFESLLIYKINTLF